MIQSCLRYRTDWISEAKAEAINGGHTSSFASMDTSLKFKSNYSFYSLFSFIQSQLIGFEFSVGHRFLVDLKGWNSSHSFIDSVHLLYRRQSSFGIMFFSRFTYLHLIGQSCPDCYMLWSHFHLICDQNQRREIEIKILNFDYTLIEGEEGR